MCQHRALSVGETDLAACFPALAAQWDQERNGDLTPQDVFPGTQRKVWWRCARGHVWQAGCPPGPRMGRAARCAPGGRSCPGKNDLATLFPAVAQAWHPDRNGSLTPARISPQQPEGLVAVSPGDTRIEAVVSARTASGSGCPYCTGRRVLAGFNDLATLEPALAQEWHPHPEPGADPDQVTSGSHKRVWWQCPRACVEGCGVQPGPGEALRLPRVRRQGQRKEPGPVPRPTPGQPIQERPEMIGKKEKEERT